MDAKERCELVSLALEHLSGVIGASGKAEELVRLTTQIVQAAKRLVEGTPEDMKSKSTTVLAEFVIAAKAIAKDARAVDSSSLQKLSSTKRAVEVLVRELDEWHISQNPSNGKDDIEVALEELGSRSSPPNTPASEAEKKLLWELKRLQKELVRKKEPQTSPKQHGQPEDALKMAVTGLTRSANELVETAGQKNPVKESLLEPSILLSKMVSTLMDLVDSLFVTKYPMRSQVHTFCSTLVENVIAYKEQSKTEDVSTLKILSTQTPALLSAVEVMVEQCYLRSQNVRESQQMSIARNVGLQELEELRPGRSPAGSPAPKRKKEVEKKPNEEVEICCMICTSVAVDQKTKDMMPKGSELTLKVLPSSTVNDIRKLLSGRIGLPLDHIEIKFQGDEALSDDTKVTPNSPLPYFVFNLHEPSEEEIRELKKNERRRNRLKIEDINWSKVTNPIAVALFDYEALGEDGNLTFDEGDLLEITEKSADGWWTGLLDGKTGVFPASFVEELQQPKSKEEEKRLVRRIKQMARGEQAQTETVRIDDIPTERRATYPAHLQTIASTTNPPRAASPKLGIKALKKISSHTDLSPKTSPSPTKKVPKLERGISEPTFSQFEQPREAKGSKGGGKKHPLFKKKTGNYAPIIEEGRGRDRERLTASDIYPKPRSPILSSPARKRNTGPDFIWEETSSSGPAANGVPVATHASMRPLVRPVSSPKLLPKGDVTSSGSTPRPASEMVSGPSGGASPSQRPRRPPPPVPKPYAAFHGQTGLTNLLQRQLSNESDEEKREQLSRVLSPPLMMKPVSESPPCITISPDPLEEDESSVQARREGENALAPPPSDLVKGSSSMEELFKNLEEFDLLNGSEMNELGVQGEAGSRDYATIPRSELPEEKKEVEEKQEEEEEEEEEEGEEGEGEEEVKVREMPKVNDNVYDVLKPQPATSISETELESKPHPQVSPPPPQGETTRPKAPIKPPSLPSKPVTFSKPKPPPKKPGMVADKVPPCPGDPSPPLQRPVQNGLDREKKSASPQPVPPPRTKKKHLSHKMMDRMLQYEKEAENKRQEEEQKSEQKMSPAPSRRSPVPPPKPPTDRRPAKANKTKSRLEILEKSGQCASAPVSRTASPDEAKLSHEGSVSTEDLVRDPRPRPGGSPVVMRRTRTVVSSNTSKPHSSDSDQDDCTGIGKEGILHKEGTSSRDWKARYFKLQESQIIYFESDSFSGDMKPLGQIPVRRMIGAIPIGEKNGFQSFAINMRYDTSVVLGSHTKTEMDDWVKSINMMIKTLKENGGRTSSYGPAFKTAIKCITYLSEGDHPAEDRIFIGVGGKSEKVKNWLHTIDRGEDADLSDMPDAITAVGLLRELFREGRVGCLVQHDLAKDLCELVKSTSPVSVLGTKLEGIPNDSRGLLKQLLRLFEQVIENSDKNHTGVADLNRVFGPLIFEKVSPSELEPLLAYLISTCELIIS